MLKIIEIATGEVVETINTEGKSERQVEKMLRGYLAQMDTSHFFIGE